MISAFHDPYDPRFRAPLGALKAGEHVLLRLRAPGAERAFLRLWRGGQELLPMSRGKDGCFEIDCPAGERTGVLWYSFVCESSDGEKTCVGKPEGEVCGVFAGEVPSFGITVYAPDFRTPEWMRDSVMLQIFPDRFAVGKEGIFPPRGRDNYLHARWDELPHVNTNPLDDDGIDFFGGNLFGIAEKMDYIADMGIRAIYLNPIFTARSNHKYDTADYLHVDPCFGGDAALEALLRASEKAGIRLVTDGVFSHTGADSVYFNKFNTFSSQGAYNSYGDSPYSSWYRFEGGREKYGCWWGFTSLPEVNETDPAFLDFIIQNGDSVAARYLKKGTSGWRLDVADELPMEFLRAFRRRVKDVKSDACVIGEVWEDITCKTAYGEERCYSAGDTLDSAMNYPLREHILSFLLGRESAYRLAEFLCYQQSSLPRPQYESMMNLLGSHDRPRVISVLAGQTGLEPPRRERHGMEISKKEYELGKSRFLKAFELVCFLPGMPCLYYGDDMGLTGMTDPFCRGTYPWNGGDRELHGAVSEIIRKRNQSEILRRGVLRASAPDGDTLEIRRVWGGEEQTYTLKRDGII